jgi:hypothetical protein
MFGIVLGLIVAVLVVALGIFKWWLIAGPVAVAIHMLVLRMRHA